MSKIPAILSATLTVSLAACADDHTPIGQPMTTPLVTSDGASVGTLSVYNSTDGLFVTASAGEGWELTDTRMVVTTSRSAIPLCRDGSPNLGRYWLQRRGKPAAPQLSYALPLLVDPGTELFLSLRASVRPSQGAGRSAASLQHDCDNGSLTTPAWAQGPFLSGNRGAMYVTYTVRDAAAPTLAGQFRTYTQAAWGVDPQGNNPGAYLQANFSAAFGSSLTIGTSREMNARFTMAQAVSRFLPQAGVPAALAGRTLNPTDLSNPFAGEVLALSLTVGFDRQDPDFSASTIPFETLVVADPSSPYFGLPVSDVLSAANQLLAGLTDPQGVSLQEAYDTVVRINATFEDGTVDRGFLGLP